MPEPLELPLTEEPPPVAGVRGRPAPAAGTEAPGVSRAPGARAVPPAGRVRLRVDGLHCASCVERVETALKSVKGVTSASLNFATGEALVVVRPGTADAAGLERVVAAAGYSAVVVAPSSQRAGAKSDGTPDRLRLMVCLPLGAVVVALSWILPAHGPRAAWALWLPVLLATPIQWWGGWPFITAAVAAARQRRADMFTLIALGTTAAWAAAVAQAVRLAPSASAAGGMLHMGAETVATLVPIVLLGRVLEMRARRQAGGAIEALSARRPVRVRRLMPVSNDFEEIAADDLRPGDRVLTRPGESLPADGVVREGQSHVDEGLLTGESRPVRKAAGDPVYAGTVNLAGALTVEVTAVGDGSALGRIMGLVQEALNSKAGVERLADRAATIFVPIVIAVAAAAGVGWLLAGAGWGAAVSRMTAVLMLACPCAMGLATPIAVLVGVGRGAELGILIRGGERLEAAARITTAVFDKTGTLTHGYPEVEEVVAVTSGLVGGPEDALAWAAAVEARSEHPAALAIVKRAQEKLETRLGEKSETRRGEPELPLATNVEVVVGRGVRGRVNGRLVIVGNEPFLVESGVPLEDFGRKGARFLDAGKTAVYLAIDGQVCAVFAVGDRLRPDASAAVTALKKLGIEVRLLSGDRRPVAETIATQAGIEFIHAEVTPADKARVVQELRGARRVVAMVGDGLNDAPALAAADVGVALGSGTDVARAAADITLVSDRVLDVAVAIRLARLTVRTIRTSLAWAFAYNIVGLPLAAVGFIPPVAASVAMAASSLAVVLNALRLRRVHA